MAYYRLLITCPDQRGIVAAISARLYRNGANIIDAAQHTTNPDGGAFFMRLEYQLSDPDNQEAIEHALTDELSERFNIQFRFADRDKAKRISVLVSRHDHCLLDLLWRWGRREFEADIVHVISNHPDLQHEVERFNLPYIHIPVSAATKPQAEARILELTQDRVDVIVLARYMQILSSEFLGTVGVPIINIHHSFLPAFVGRNPYQRALERGVKIIGATAHYVTDELDEGPIIDQDVARVSHRDGLREMERIGRDVERTVLARALRWHLDDRVIVYQNKTFVFH